jgi:hypothetical protein
LSEPVASTLANGQVNLLIAALVLADAALLRGRRGHGIATGLATGIKLTRRCSCSCSPPPGSGVPRPWQWPASPPRW